MHFKNPLDIDLGNVIIRMKKMKKIIINALLISVAFLMTTGCGTKSSEGDQSESVQAKTDKEIIAEQVAAYPLKTCVVTGDSLDSMGEPLDYVHDGRLVRFCCKSCIEEFTETPEKFLAMIDTASHDHDKAGHSEGDDHDEGHSHDPGSSGHEGHDH